MVLIYVGYIGHKRSYRATAQFGSISFWLLGTISFFMAKQCLVCFVLCKSENIRFSCQTIRSLPAIIIVIIIGFGAGWHLAHLDLQSSSHRHRTHNIHIFYYALWNIVLFCVLLLSIWFWHRVISALPLFDVGAAPLQSIWLHPPCVILLYLIFYLSFWGEWMNAAQLGPREEERTRFHSYWIVCDRQTEWVSRDVSLPPENRYFWRDIPFGELSIHRDIWLLIKLTS